MEEGFSRRDDVHLLQLYNNHKLVNNKTISVGKKLELRLAPPGDEEYNWSHGNNSTSIAKNNFTQKDHDPSVLSLGNSFSFSKRGLENMNTSWSSSSSQDLLPVMGKEWCCSKGMVTELQNNTEKQQQAFSPVNKTAGPNTSHKRNAPAPAPVVGWPPIRSFRKNIASSSTSKLKIEAKQQNVSEKQVETCCKGLFVKINMDGVPIGRKVDLKAYDSYEKLSSSVDKLFSGLLAAQRNDKIQNSREGNKLITGLLDGRGEYTLVYEDNEGDRMLVGDVPWHMFVCTVKRLRVLKTSEIFSLFLGGSKQEKKPVDAACIETTKNIY